MGLRIAHEDVKFRGMPQVGKGPLKGFTTNPWHAAIARSQVGKAPCSAIRDEVATLISKDGYMWWDAQSVPDMP